MRNLVRSAALAVLAALACAPSAAASVLYDFDLLDTEIVPTGVSAMTVGQFESGPRPDLALVSPDSTLRVFSVNQALTADAPVALAGVPTDVASGVLTDAPFEDIVVAIAGTPSRAQVLKLVSGTYTHHGFLTATEGVQVVEAGDVNGDGAEDIITAAGNGITAHLNGGNGTFPTVVTGTVSGSGFNDLAVGDFDEDGADDIATVRSNGAGGLMHVVTMRNGTLQTLNGGLSTQNEPFTEVDLFDFNRDGHLDYSGLRTTAGPTMNLGAGAEDILTNMAVTGHTGTAHGQTAGDMDGDGFGELVVLRTSITTPQVAIHDMQDPGTVSLAHVQTVNAAPDDVAAGPWSTGDFVDDLVILRSGALELWVNRPLILPGGGRFGDQTVGQESATQTITLTNRGAGAADVTSHSLTGIAAPDFDLLSNGCLSMGWLEHGETCTIAVSFTPVAAGARAAELTLTLAGGAPSVVVPLTGTGVAANAGPTGPQGPAGTNGTNGTDGINGTNGTDGTNGTNGTTGPAGPQGETGAPGVQGIQGLTGLQGPSGPQGPQGPAGRDALVTCKAPKSLKKGKKRITITCKVTLPAGTAVRLRQGRVIMARARVGRAGRLRLTGRLRRGSYVLEAGGARAAVRIS